MTDQIDFGQTQFNNTIMPVGPDALNAPSAGKRPMFPVASILNAILGNQSNVPNAVDSAENFAFDAFQNPGTGSIGMARGRWLTPQQMQEMVELYNRTRNTNEVARLLGRDQGTVIRALNRSGVDTTPNRRAAFTQEQIDDIYQRRANGESWSFIAEHLGRNRGTLQRDLAQQGIQPTRPMSRQSLDTIANSIGRTISQRREIYTQQQVDDIYQRRANGESWNAIAENLGVSRTTLQRNLIGQSAQPSIPMTRQNNVVNQRQEERATMLDPGIASMIRDSETRLLSRGMSPEVVSRRLNEEYGINSTPEQIRSSSGFWRRR